MCTIPPRQQLSSPNRMAIRRRNVIRRVLPTGRIKRAIDSSFRNSLNINHIRSHNLHIFHSRFAHGSTKMEEHHQLRGDDDESHRNNQTHSRCTPRDSALPPLDWHVYFPNVEYDVTSDRRCELASKLIDAFCLATNGAELFDQVIIIYCVFSRRDEKRPLSLPLSFSRVGCLLARRKRRSRALSFALILRFSKAETTALSLSLCDKLPFYDVDSLSLFSSLK